MPYRHRLPYAALGGFLAVILGVSLALAQEKKPPVLKDQPVSQGQKTPDKKGAKAESQKNTPPPEQLTPTLHQIESAIRELVNQQRAAQEKGPTQHEIKDLKAQDDMAFWAKLMFFATMVAVGLTGFGIWLIKRTLDETKVAAKHTEGMLEEAKKTTEAAHAAIQATDKNAERQLRAYVHISNAEVVTIGPASNQEVVLVIKNYGQTPSSHARTRAGAGVQEWPLKTQLPDVPEDILEGIGPLPPGRPGTLSVPVPKLNDREMGELQAGRAAIFCYGEITYDDGFSPVQRWTKFRLACHGEGLADGHMQECEEGNEAT